MKKLLLFTSLLMAFAVTAESKKNKSLTEKDMGAYLFTYFNDPTHALFMAISYDGYTFTAVNNGEPIISGDSIADQHGIRDRLLVNISREGSLCDVGCPFSKNKRL